MLLAPALYAGQQQAQAASIQGCSPEVEATVWQDDSTEFASVSLNGKELLTFKGESGYASGKAEELAARLQELLDDRKFDASEIVPARSGSLATIQQDGNTVLSFESDSPDDQTAAETSWKLVNSIRLVFGAPTLPSSYLKLVDQAEQKTAGNSTFSGQASWYGGRFHGRKTSDGHRYDQEKMTAAHRSLPFGTKLLVMNRKTGSTCIVEVNDRGPFVADRVIDLSRAAARQLNMISTGVALVDCLVLNRQ